MFVQTWGTVIFSSLEAIWIGFVNFIPDFISALIIFLVGLIIAVGLAKLVRRLINILRLDSVLEKMGFRASLEKAGLKLDIGYFVGELVKWFLVVAFLLAATKILGLDEVSLFLRDVLTYIPKVIIAVFILLAALIVATFLEKVVQAAILASDFSHALFLATVTKWSIFVFAIFAALTRLDVAPNLIGTLFTGFVAMVAIGGGIAFGLGGKEYAQELIGLLKRSIKK
ncbi:MAG: hypothetical protein US76_01420 [Parcubacteria group bacterium GW2011_GWA2_38_13b]|nr:MAG: hypothetical protein US76_01420 [Parcubacteria group bacterium GW2011_GWA2_38_13b]